MLRLGHRFHLSVLIVVGAALAAYALPVADPGIEAMKARVSLASIGERPHLCVQIAEHQLA